MAKDIPQDVAQLALDSWYMELEDGCRISMGKYNESNGYNYIKSHLAHRAAWTAVNGQIPDGMVIDHKCFTRSCVNPDHLRAITFAQNVARKSKWGEDWPLDECRWGHKLTEQVITGKTVRRSRCGPCQKVRNDETTVQRMLLRRLEIAYGLGDWHTSNAHPRAQRERRDRISALKHVGLNSETT